ncbi:SH3 domain-containing protein [Aristaeella lactis]|uniref:Uncharacterized conserved protein YgiM, contains N-terminal SH3 domain, DUF1202 family n=1 Tax=Aristaeella lactis TaxID=3046383 RepID=A0AC61PQ20_9FIRM|nr:SH3 domain-containing protein [Aristaeella lactis]QUA54233.1 SH3 domain-containing protein [Aristaeella lactis]SMC88167.1 Uncharacterized conserved protein YgiM, contains N-terminal SH3 domain, DUF1202 family [Aristaeella lactis]
MKKRLIALLLVLALLIPAAVASAATWYRVNTTSLRVRFLPDTSAKEIGSYRKDYACTIDKNYKDGWSYVTFSNGTQGYVQTKYITKASSYKAWIYKDDTSLRKGPDGSFQAIASLAQGTKVTVLSHGSKYDYVSAGDLGQGYVVNSLLSKKKIAPSGNESTGTASGGNYEAWVFNAADRKVNLRKNPNTNAAVIAQYPSGTQVHVVSHGETWDKVQVGGNEGWMMNRFLSTAVPAPTPDTGVAPTPESDTSYTAYAVTDNKKGVNVRKGAGSGYTKLFSVPYGAPVLVLKHDTTWDYIQYNGRKGYMMNKYLQLSKPADAANIETQDPSVVTPTPKPFEQYTTTVKVDQLNFHKQKGDWSSNVDGVGRLNSGDSVKVLEISGGWAKVEYNGYTGWVHKEFLN